MKKIEECLDLVLRALVDNGDSLCILEAIDGQSEIDKKFILSPAYDKLVLELALSNEEIKQLLEILKDEKYL